MRARCDVPPLRAVNAFQDGEARAARPFSVDRELIWAGFLNSHLDLKHRTLGVGAYNRAEYPQALHHFMRASRYADKVSQAAVAEMYWHGLGVPADRSLAYAWMDLAAERGYPDLLARRELIWASLDEAERERAISEGEAVYAEFGDADALPRMASMLRRHRMRATGSRTGYGANTRIVIPIGTGGDSVGAGVQTEDQGMVRLDGSHYYAREFWEPGRYVQWHARHWQAQRDGAGEVNVGRLQQVPASAPEETGGERLRD